MNKKDLSLKGSFITKKKAPIDLIIIVSVVILSFLLALIFNFFEVLFKVSQKFPAFFIGEFLIALVVLSIGLIIFTFRRKKELEQNIKEWIIVEKTISESEKRFQNLFEKIPTVAVQGYNRDRKVIFWNKASEELYGFTKEEAIGKKMEDLIIPSKKRKPSIKLVDSWFKKGLEFYSREQVLMRKDNSPIVVHSSQVMLRNVDNEMELYSLDINITEKKKAEEALNESYKKLQQLARTDALTQLSNRRNVLEKIEYERIKFERSKEPFSVAIGDLDDFKKVNDKYGHDCGDFVLKHVSNLMVDTVRKQDVVARYGGEEFMLLLPQTGLKGAYHIAELIRKKIAKFPITYKDKEVTMTITFGVCLYDKEMSLNQCISKADKALYKGKEEGKNRVILAES